MASLREAEAARNARANALQRMGAHSIEVARVTVRGKRTYAVIASFERAPRRAPPPAVTMKVAGKNVSVPVVVKIAPAFRPD